MASRFNTVAAACLLFSCGGSATPAAEAPMTPAAEAAVAEATAPSTPTAKTTCYAGTGVVKIPSGQEVGKTEAVARRTVDRQNATITEELATLSPRQEHYLVTLRVDGSKYTMAEQSKAFVGEGELFGEAWNWSSWRSTSTLSDGTRVESEDKVTDDGISVEKKVYSPDGALVVTITEDFETITDEECAHQFAKLPAKED